MYIPKSSFNETLQFVKDNSKSGSYFLFDIINSFSPNKYVNKVRRYFFGLVFTYFYNESLYDYYSSEVFEEVLRSFNFTIEHTYEMNDGFNDELFKFKHLSPTNNRKIYFTNKIN